MISKILYTLLFFLIWPSTVFACSLIKQPVDRFKADTFVYSAIIVDIYTHDNLFNNPEVDADSPNYKAGAISLNPIQVWSSPEDFNHHVLFLGNLMADCSYGFSTFDTISSSYSVGDTVAVVARYMKSELWQESMPAYPVLMVLPFDNGSLANTKYLSSDLSIENKVHSFTTHLDSLISEMRKNDDAIQQWGVEQHERFRNTNRRERARVSEIERERNLKKQEEYTFRKTKLTRAYNASGMRKNFEIQRNLAKVHNSRLQDERFQYLALLSNDWYARWGHDSEYTRMKFDCGYTSLIDHYISDSDILDELFELFKNNNGRTLPILNECISEFNLPFTK